MLNIGKNILYWYKNIILILILIFDIVTRSVFDALPIGSGLVAAVGLCMKREDI